MEYQEAKRVKEAFFKRTNTLPSVYKLKFPQAPVTGEP